MKKKPKVYACLAQEIGFGSALEWLVKGAAAAQRCGNCW
jgi:hypothetical protein